MSLNDPLLSDELGSNEQIHENLYIKKKKSIWTIVYLTVLGIIVTTTFTISLVHHQTHFIKNIVLAKTLNTAAGILLTGFILGVGNYIVVSITFGRYCVSCSHKNQQQQMIDLLDDIFTNYIFNYESFGHKLHDCFAQQFSGASSDQYYRQVYSSPQFKNIIDEIIDAIYQSVYFSTLNSLGIDKQILTVYLMHMIDSIGKPKFAQIINKLTTNHVISPREFAQSSQQFIHSKIIDTVSDLTGSIQHMIGDKTNWITVWATVIGFILSGCHVLLFMIIR